MDSVGYQIVHSIAGRIRIRVPWLDTDPQSTSTYQQLVEAISGVKLVRVNPLAKSIVVEYNSKIVPVAKMEDLLISTMQQVKLTPPAAAPTVEQEPKLEDQPIVSEIPIVDETIGREPAVLSVEEPAKSPPESKSPIPEIPSPWDDEPFPEPFPEPPLEESMTDTIAQQTTPIIPEMICSTSALAKRLKVTSQAITRRRLKSDFGQWTQAQDPEGVAWCYHEDDRLFRPVESE